MKKILLGFSGLAMFANTASFAQSNRCYSDDKMQQIIESNPSLKQAIADNQQARHMRSQTKAKSTATYYVPVVFHIVLTAGQQTTLGGAAGIKKRVDSSMAVLNRDFNKQNPDSTNIPTVFKPLYGNANIKFSLAHRKPNNTSTPGYQIITTTQSSFDGYGGTYGSNYFCSNVKYAASGGADAWDPTRYLNVWITNFSDVDLLGIATPRYFVSQGIPIGEVGVVVNYGAFGKRTSGADFYISGIDKGRTLTHEIGHYFDLEHIWGQQANCSDDDGIGDTPKQDDYNMGNVSVGTVYANCTGSTGGEMWMNYMDYVNDACMYMFTTQQATHMNGYYNTTLISDPNIFQWPTEVASFETTNSFEVYPNPSNGKININFASAPESLQSIIVTNMMGQKVYEQSADANTAIYNIDISDMSKGIYFVQCHFSEGVETRKIVLE